MANWATTSYRIEGKEEHLSELYGIITDFTSGKRSVLEKNASDDWEGNIVLAIGEDIADHCLRGFIQSCELEKDVLSVEAEEAWGATDFRHLLERHYDGMKVYYIVEEPGMEVYATNDEYGKYFSYKFVVDMCVGGNDKMEYFSSQEDALAYVAKCLGLDSFSMDDLEKWNESHEDDDSYIYIHEFDIVD